MEIGLALAFVSASHDHYKMEQKKKLSAFSSQTLAKCNALVAHLQVWKALESWRSRARMGRGHRPDGALCGITVQTL